jgi:hypothetical protein
MTPTEFDFTVTMPGDSRLVGAIRQLTAHAAGYAQLATDAGEAFADHVQDATEAAIAASNVQGALIRYRFTADPEAIVVVFSCEVPSSASRPGSAARNGVTIDWTSEGSRYVCRIRQPLGPQT